jgi:hypothetical protein
MSKGQEGRVAMTATEVGYRWEAMVERLNKSLKASCDVYGEALIKYLIEKELDSKDKDKEV